MDNNKIKNFTDLVVWQEGHKTVLEIYRLTKTFPKDELFCLISQMRRAAVSITSNISEGFSRQHRTEKIQFYCISQGSLTELQNQLIIAKDLKYISDSNFDKLFSETTAIQMLLNGLIRSIKKVASS